MPNHEPVRETASKPRRDPASASQTQEAPESSEGRHDPKPRHIEGVTPWAKLINADRSKHYVLVNKAGEFGVEFYASRGYEIERQSETGVRLAAGYNQKVGEPIENFGTVLMSCSAERKAEIDRFGDGMATGQVGADQVERSIIDRSASRADAMRGISPQQSRYFEVTQDHVYRTTPLEREVG